MKPNRKTQPKLDAHSRLQPGQNITIPFPSLPRPFSALAGGKPAIPCLDIRLPDNYKPGRKFPLFVHIPGGSGSYKGNLAAAREIIGTRNWILASLPLFKKSFDKKEIYGGILICHEDRPMIAASYAVMLKRLFRLIPNIDFKRSVIGGSSNGAHTVALLITAQDPVILKYFRGYYFGDGGILQLSDLHKLSLRGHRFLMIVGAKDRRKVTPRNLLDLYLIQSRLHEAWAKINGLDFRRIERPDMGHAFDARCMAAVRRWARRKS